MLSSEVLLLEPFLKIKFNFTYFHRSMFMDTPEDERTKLVSCLGAFRQYWSTLPQVRILLLLPLPQPSELHRAWHLPEW